MQTYSAGTTVSVTIPFKDEFGNDLVPVALSARVLDQDGVEIVAPVSVEFDPGDIDVTIAVAGPSNAISAGGAFGARTVELTIVTAAGNVLAGETYMLRAAAMLQLFVNSFQTYERALVEGEQIVGLTGWQGASSDDRKIALMDAFFRLTRYAYRIAQPSCEDRFTYVDFEDTSVVLPKHWQTTMTLDRWNGFPERFKTALRRAQVTQANDLIANSASDSFESKRDQGIFSESIGESKVMFRSGKGVQLHASRKALAYVGPFIDRRVRLVRS